MTSKQIDVVKDIRSAVRLEQELQVSFTQKGVCVVDVYSVEWGPCKAINETFRRLVTDQMDGTPLRFVSAECHSILSSLNGPDAERNHQRPRNIKAISDTLPEAWRGTLEERAGLSKPYFMFYKDGKLCGTVNGVNTPVIRRMTKELCSVKVPAHENISNPDLLDFWEDNFNGDESEVSFEKFIHSLGSSCDASEPLDSDEKCALMDALHIKPESKEKIVTAEALQRWVGDDETLYTVFHQLLPDYKSRAEQSRIKREAEKRCRLEEQEAQQKELAAETRKKVAMELLEKQQRLQVLSSDIKNLTAETQLTAEDVHDLENVRVKRDALDNITKEGVATPQWNISFHELDDEAYFTQLVSTLTSCGTLYSHLRDLGMTVVDILDAQQAVEAYLKNSNLQPPGSFGGLCVSSIASDVDELLAPASEKESLDYYDSAAGNELVTKHPTLALQLLHTAITDEDASVLYFYGKRDSVTGIDLLKEGDQVAMSAFTLLDKEPPTQTQEEGEVLLTVEGISQGIFLEHVSIRNTKQMLTHWVSKHDVIEISEHHIKVRFNSFIGDAQLSSIMEATEADIVHDLDEISVIGHLRQYVQEEESIIAYIRENEHFVNHEVSHHDEHNRHFGSHRDGSHKVVDEEQEAKYDDHPSYDDGALVDKRSDDKYKDSDRNSGDEHRKDDDGSKSFCSNSTSSYKVVDEEHETNDDHPAYDGSAPVEENHEDSNHDEDNRHPESDVEGSHKVVDEEQEGNDDHPAYDGSAPVEETNEDTHHDEDNRYPESDEEGSHKVVDEVQEANDDHPAYDGSAPVEENHEDTHHDEDNRHPESGEEGSHKVVDEEQDANDDEQEY